MTRFNTETFWLRIVTCVMVGLSSTVLHAQMPGAPSPKPIPLPHPEIAPPSLPDPGLPVWMYVVGALALLGFVTLILWLLLRTPSSAKQAPVAPLKRALERLKELQSHLDNVQPPEVAHQVSVILREYQEGRYAVPAPYRTSEELYQSMEAPLKEGVQERFGPLAAIYDRLAFAPVLSCRRDAVHLVDAALGALEQEKLQQAAVVRSPADSEPDHAVTA